jgi:microcephalin
VPCAAAELADIAAATTSALPGLRLCPFAGAGVTHLVLGPEPKRTLKVLHALTRGAWLLRAEWLLRSAAAGAWLPEAAFAADDVFPGAARARAAMAEGASGRRLLTGLRVAIAEPRRAAPPASELRTLVVALGGTYVPPRPNAKCDVYITAGATAAAHTAAQPRSAAPAAAAPSGALVVTEQWLLDAIAQYELPADATRYVPH